MGGPEGWRTGGSFDVGRGAAVRDGEDAYRVEAPQVDAVDTTGAGDALAGAFAASLVAGVRPADAIGFAVAYASESVRHAGTQTAFPTEWPADSRR